MPHWYGNAQSSITVIYQQHNLIENYWQTRNLIGYTGTVCKNGQTPILEALLRSRMNGLILAEKTIQQTRETQCPLPQFKTITAANKQKNYKLTRAATLPKISAHIFLYHYIRSTILESMFSATNRNVQLT